MEFSVLLSVYQKEKAEYLRQALDSIFSQTLLPTEIILVEDGPLPDSLHEVIRSCQQEYPILKTVSLTENRGLGEALNEGLRHCSYDIVARMDTDDISKPDRFRLQTAVLEERPEIDVVSGWLDEFSGTPDNILSTRKVPSTHAAIVDFGKRRNPVNHPTVMFRKRAVMAAGGYQHFPLFEDYYLWVRMMLNGSVFYNLPQSLLWFRLTPDLFQRRGGISYIRSEAVFQRRLRQMGYIGSWRMYKNMLIRLTIRLLPNHWREILYIKLIRK